MPSDEMSVMEIITGLISKSKDLDQLRKEQEDVLQEINRMHKKFQSAPEAFEKSGDALQKLGTLYGHAKELAENEVSIMIFSSASNQMVLQLESLLQSGLSATQRKNIESEQKKKRMKSDTDIPRFPTAVSMRSQVEHFASLKGEQVAARIKNDDAEKEEWVIVKVIHFDKDAKEKFKLPMSRIITFPKKGEPSNAPDFPPGKHVLALYSGTTALYKATVVNHRKRKADDYILEFDDDEEDGSLPQRNVPFHKVAPLPWTSTMRTRSRNLPRPGEVQNLNSSLNW